MQTPKSLTNSFEIAGILSHGQKRGSFARARKHDGECAREHSRRSLHGRAHPRAMLSTDTLYRRVGGLGGQNS